MDIKTHGFLMNGSRANRSPKTHAKRWMDGCRMDGSLCCSGGEAKVAIRSRGPRGLAPHLSLAQLYIISI